MEKGLEVINRVTLALEQGEDSSTGFDKICNESARLRLRNKEKLLEKTVYMCHRGPRKNKSREPKNGRRHVNSKKDIECCYEMWVVVFASEPQNRYFITVHGHTGHDPENNPQERRWLNSLEQGVVENYCFKLFPLMTPAQILDQLHQGVTPGDFSNSLASLTLDRIKAIQQKYWRRSRICDKDSDAVRKLIHAPNFPLLSCSKDLKKGLSIKSADVLHYVHRTEGFHIVICSKAQSLLLRKLGDLVFLDAVHGTTKYGYLNLTMLVLDEFGHGFPVAFMLSQTETSNDWNFLIKSVFEKSGRDPSRTTFMIDKSTTIRAAIDQVGGNYFLCIFHMMQDIDRRLNRHVAGIQSKKKSKIKGRINYEITTLRHIRDEGIFLDRSRAFKNRILQDPRGMSNVAGFVTYYEKNWEACADKWAAFGRLEFAEYQQDTNNLIESFFRQLRNRHCRDKKTRLDEHLRVLAYNVIPTYLRRRSSIEMGLMGSKNKESNEILENQVLQMIKGGLFKLDDTSTGTGFVHYKKSVNWFCMAELSCTCQRNSVVCVHIEAAFRHFGSNNVQFTYEILLKHADYLRKSGAVKFVSGTEDRAITHVAPPSWSRSLDNKNRMYYIDSGRRVCTCPMFQCMKFCGHILATVADAVLENLNDYGLDYRSVMPAHVFQHPRICTARHRDLSIQINDELASCLEQECSLQLERSDEPIGYELSSLASSTKLRQICWRIPEEKQEEAAEMIEELTHILEKNFLLSELPTTFTKETVEVEKKRKYSRISTDRKYKPLFPVLKK